MNTTFVAKRSLVVSLILVVAAGTAAFVGVSLLSDPNHFYASYGFELGGHPSLSSEVRGAAGLLVTAAAVLLTGAFNVRHTARAAAVGAVVYLGYAGGRAVSVLATALPHPDLVYAALVEAALGVACVWVYLRARETQNLR